MRDDFAVFILTHGRPYNIKTLEALEKGNYTGKIYIIIDDEDRDKEKYHYLFGDKVIEFNKLEASKTFDVGDNFKERRAVVYARNASFDIAEQLGINYFLQLDDDYSNFVFRKIVDNSLVAVNINNLDKMFEATIDFLEVSGASTVAYAQGGDFIGGVGNDNFHKGILRKAMNSFFMKTDRRFDFLGKINEDVTAYVTHGMMGKLFFTITPVNIFQIQTQKNKGGLTDIYLDLGTYVKSFYSVMYAPSCVVVAPMGQTHMRLHHRVHWNNCVPKILPPELKKEA
jgi:hypothetical protein